MLGSVSRRKVVKTDTFKMDWDTLCDGRIALGSRATHMMVHVLAYQQSGNDGGNSGLQGVHDGTQRSLYPPSAQTICTLLLLWAQKNLCSMSLVHVPGSSNIGADMLSHGGPPPGHRDSTPRRSTRYGAWTGRCGSLCVERELPLPDKLF